MYRAAFTALYERSRAMYPQIENKWGTPEIEDWCELMHNLMRAEEVPVEIPGDKVTAWRVCGVCGSRAFKDDLCAVHWAARNSCVPEWHEGKGGWYCKNCHRGVDADSLKEPCVAKTMVSGGTTGGNR